MNFMKLEENDSRLFFATLFDQEAEGPSYDKCPTVSKSLILLPQRLSSQCHQRIFLKFAWYAVPPSTSSQCLPSASLINALP